MKNLRIHRWVVWWMVLGVICGVVAVTNILERNLSHAQERILLAMGALNWILGGLVCYACEGIRFEEPPHANPPIVQRGDQEWYSHAPSDFLLPGNRKSLLPPKYR